MSDFNASMASSASGMVAQTSRLRLSAENIANADTPGYRAKQMQFQLQTGADGALRVLPGRVELSSLDGERTYQPGHPMADAEGYFVGSNVNLATEIANAREAQRSYEANLRMFDQARQMASSLIGLLRR
ncbi:flagellar basal body rod protein FlgC [Pontivivens insulae]|uniref:Flagellar basal-body rod protein FlgC n=1 Tax=Pontivivens insulae TaxID=1639689 RepID=A0A2R8A9E9_9RHOB|nr:flagellar basal body rod protein FlgC [Pontivivens insulae]RED12766.1 flagellar basal-body rod protein FlgC [Pontivivens insulae]SPF28857.1 Flagellar basal-body rod protein FlgC [Pontivivens insulae]